MVGKKAKITEILNKFVDKPYKYGEIDCFRIVDAVKGDKFDEPFQGYTRDTYSRLLDEEEASKVLVRLIKSSLKKVEIPDVGDVVIIEHIDLVGVYAGNNHVMTAISDKGIKVLPLEIFKRFGTVTYWR